MGVKSKGINNIYVMGAIAVVAEIVMLVIAGYIKNGEVSISEILYPVLYTVCFAFLFVFYADSSVKVPVIRLSQNLLLAASIVVAFAGFEVTVLPEFLNLFVISVVLISGLFEAGLGMIMLGGSLLYGIMFYPEASLTMLPSFLMAGVLGILASRIRKKSPVVIVIEISAAFFAVVKLLLAGFSIKEVLVIDTLFELLYYVAIILVAYLMKQGAESSVNDFELEAAVEDINAANDISKSGDKQHTNETKIKVNKHADKELERLNSENEAMREKLRAANEELEALRVSKDEELNQYKNALGDRVYKIEKVASLDFSFSKDLATKNPKLFKHCLSIAEIAKEAAELIGANGNLAFAIGLSCETAKAFGKDAKSILAEYGFPESVIEGVAAVKIRPKGPVSREAGIVIMTSEIKNTAVFAKMKGMQLPADKIVSNVLKAKKDQNLIRYAGLSVEEIQLIKLLLNDKFAEA